MADMIADTHRREGWVSSPSNAREDRDEDSPFQAAGEALKLAWNNRVVDRIVDRVEMFGKLLMW